MGRTDAGGARGAGGSATPATAAGVPFTTHSYLHDPAATSYGLAAASARGVDPGQVFKTLVAQVDGQLTVAVVPVTGQLDLKALASAVGGKRAQLADLRDAQRSSGYVAAGISPLGQRQRLPTVIDSTAIGLPTVYVSGGRRGLKVQLSGADLVRLTGAVVAPLGRHG